jgi:hypothetical protein
LPISSSVHQKGNNNLMYVKPRQGHHETASKNERYAGRGDVAVGHQVHPTPGRALRRPIGPFEVSVIEKILTHLGLQARAPPRAPARDQALQAA